MTSESPLVESVYQMGKLKACFNFAVRRNCRTRRRLVYGTVLRALLSAIYFERQPDFFKLHYRHRAAFGNAVFRRVRRVVGQNRAQMDYYGGLSVGDNHLYSDLQSDAVGCRLNS